MGRTGNSSKQRCKPAARAAYTLILFTIVLYKTKHEINLFKNVVSDDNMSMKKSIFHSIFAIFAPTKG